jgi:photosystem II stability/assembly factor-like uncharacterized protein
VYRPLLLMAAGALIAVACDDDPSAPVIDRPVGQLVTPTVITREGSIGVVFRTPLDPRSAQDPENFVVVNQCNGLRVAGSLRLGQGTASSGDTLIFTPSTRLPFLTLLSVRVQNLLSANGTPMEQPFTTTVTTEAPVVSDISWEAVQSPTNDLVLGATFATRSRVFLSASSGAVYRSENAGATFAAVFKDVNIISTRSIRTAGPDTVFMVGALNEQGSFATAAILRSTNGGVTFTPMFRQRPADMRSLTVIPRGATKPSVFVAGNLGGSFTVWRYDTQTDSVFQLTPVAGHVANGGDLSADLSHAVAVGFVNTAQQPGAAYRSTDGGRSYQAVTLPPITGQLRAAAFHSNNAAVLVGDSASVVTLDAATGAVARVTDGVPQNSVVGQTTMRYSWRKIAFVPGSQVGWIAGIETLVTPNQPDDVRGVILMTRNGGTSWQRQAVTGAPDNGLAFSTLVDVHALAVDRAIVGGLQGFVATRNADTQTGAEICSISPDE